MENEELKMENGEQEARTTHLRLHVPECVFLLPRSLFPFPSFLFSAFSAISAVKFSGFGGDVCLRR